jgi:hypothetical protein
MKLDDLAAKLFALEAIDKAPFQRRARMLQSLWRTERGYACGEHIARGKSRPLGSRLAMPWARDELANFMTERVREVVRSEVLDPHRSNGKLFGKPRIFNDLLSSQPLCFNLFGELRSDLPLASKLVERLTTGRFTDVVAVEFEHSPARSDARYSNDRSAFDVFLECRTSRGGRAFLAIEVKYHENLAGPAATHRTRYDELAAQMGCFRSDATTVLQRPPLQQLWRDHLLSGAVRHVDGFEDAQFVVLYPRENEACRRAVEAYRATLSDARSFDTWLLEDVLGFLAANTSAAWPALVFDRYCNFTKLTAVAQMEEPG